MSGERAKNRALHKLLGQWIFGLDRWLCRRFGIYEYSARPDCLFRAEIGRADERVRLSDGLRVQVGDPLLELHLWNEHVPPMGRQPSVAWGRRTARMMDASLSELAGHLAQSADCRAVVALRAQMRLRTGRQSAQLASIFRRFGFEAVPHSRAERPGPLRLLGENILVALLMIAANPVSLRSGLLRRNCTRVIISREAFLRRYGRSRPALGTDRESAAAARAAPVALSAAVAATLRSRPHRQGNAPRPGGSSVVRLRRPGYWAGSDRGGAAPARARKATAKPDNQR